MRIAFLIYGSLDTLTGGYLYDAYMVKSLRQRGHDVEVISLPVTSYPQKLLHNVSGKLLRRLLEGNFEVIVQDELCHPSLFWTNSKLRREGGPYLVALVHHIFSEEQRNPLANRLFSLIERRYLNSVDGFIFNSATTRDVVTPLITTAQPGVIAYPAGNRFGIELTKDEIARRAHRTGPLELLFFGNIIERKGLVPLLHALAGLERHIWQLTIVGSPDFEPEYSRRARTVVDQLGLERNVVFHGVLEDEGLIEVLKKCHIFCTPFAYEGFGIAMLEAMAFGQPPLVSSSGAAGETVKHGENGYLFGADQNKEVQKSLTALYHDRTRLLQLSLAAKDTFAKSPGWRDGADQVEKFLHHLLSGTEGKHVPDLQHATE